jgi:hypothetical protein
VTTRADLLAEVLEIQRLGRTPRPQMSDAGWETYRLHPLAEVMWSAGGGAVIAWLSEPDDTAPAAAPVAFPHTTEACRTTFEGETQVTSSGAEIYVSGPKVNLEVAK